MMLSHKKNNRFVIVHVTNKVILAIVYAMVYCLQCFFEQIFQGNFIACNSRMG